MQEKRIPMTFSDGCIINNNGIVTIIVVKGAEVQLAKIRPYRYTEGDKTNAHKNT